MLQIAPGALTATWASFSSILTGSNTSTTLTATRSAMNSYARLRTGFPDVVRPGDTLVRLSGDELVVPRQDLQDAADARRVASRIDEASGPAFVLTGIEISITASVGMAFAGLGEEVSPLLLAQANESMYRARRGQAKKPAHR